jgi:creatinine amidohydrolase
MSSNPVRWADLRPLEFAARLNDCPIVYLPVGLCEPHGHVAALGLDMHVADALCEAGARAYGGIVAPTQGYHIHETGYHAAWLEETVGEHNARMASIPPHVFCLQYLYQLRAFANAGFKAVFTLTGHGGGNEHDLRTWGDAFTARFGLPVTTLMQFELAPGFRGDHAGRYEVSLLWHLRPELVDMTRLDHAADPQRGGRLAQGEDAAVASPEYGAAIFAQVVETLGARVAALRARAAQAVVTPRIDHAAIEALYAELRASARSWVTMNPRPGQPAVSETSQWKPYEFGDMP